MQGIVSIITPIYNRLDLVPETWASIQTQTFPNWEWILVDDGSTDKGPEYIQQLADQDNRVKLYYRTSGPKGPSACRNLGVQHATGKYLLFLDSDDLISPTCLEKRVVFLETHQNLDFAVFTQALFSENINRVAKIFSKFYANKEEYLKAFIGDQHPWQTSGPLWQKNSFFKTGGFREDYTIMEDPELHIRALLSNMQFEVINDEPDFFYRQTPKTKEQEERFWENSIKGRITFYKNLYPTLTYPDQKKALSQGIILLYKTFLLSRINLFQKEHQEFFCWIKMNKQLNKTDIFLINGYNIFATNRYLNHIPLIKRIIFYWI